MASTAWPTPKPVDDSAGVEADALAVMSRSRAALQGGGEAGPMKVESGVSITLTTGAGGSCPPAAKSAEPAVGGCGGVRSTSARERRSPTPELD